ncbi:MAG: hypothetical protein KDA66_13300 [Planctomycetaceae bacterium]|nr:hypothetical protein [Planctomycetaceae bacterium]
MFVRLLASALLVAALAPVVSAQDAEPKSKKWEGEMQKFDKQDQEHPKPRGGVVFVGSSSIRMWDVKKSFPDLAAINHGFGGSEIIDSVYYFDRLVTPYKPRLIVFYAGDNDIAHNTTPAQVHENFQKFVALMHEKLPETKLVFVPIKPSLKRWELIETIREANALIHETCDADDKLTYLEIEKPMLGDDGTPRPELFAKDGLHLSPEGYALWNSLLRPHLKK